MSGPNPAAQAVLLLVPPLANNQVFPELGVPQLTAFLKARGHAVRQLDLNAGMVWSWLGRPANLAAALGYLSADALAHAGALPGFLAAQRARVANALGGIRPGPPSPETDRLRDLVRRYLDQREILQPTPRAEIVAAGGPPARDAAEVLARLGAPLSDGLLWVLLVDLLRRELVGGGTTADEVEAAALRATPLLDAYLAEHLDPALTSDVGLVGLSIHGMAQVVAALRIARRVRERLPGARILLGGPWCTAAAGLLADLPFVFDFADAIVPGEGETALAAAAEALRSGGDPTAVPGVIRRAGTRIVAADPAPLVPLEELPAPCFDGFPMKAYPAPVVPFRTVRGCYWSRCVFCYHVADGAPACRTDDPSPVLKDRLAQMVRLASSHHGTRALVLADHATPPGHLRMVAAAVREAGTRIAWEALVRFDEAFGPDLFRELAAAGCATLSFGLETSSEPALRRLRKGIRRDLALRCLEQATAAGIETSVFVLHYPGQKLAEYAATLDFVCEHHDVIGWFSAQRFQLGRHTHSFSRPEALGIQPAADAASDLDVFDLPFEAEGWAPEAEFRRVTEEGSLRFLRLKAGA
jgi:hypothetical protein